MKMLGAGSSIVQESRMGVRGRLTLALVKPAYEYGRGAVEAQRMYPPAVGGEHA